MYTALIEELYLDDSADQLNQQIDKTEKPFIMFAERGGRPSGKHVLRLMEYLEAHAECPAAQGLVSTRGNKVLSYMKRLSKKALVLDASKDWHDVLIHLQGLIIRTSVLRESGVRFDGAFEYVRDQVFACQLSRVVPVRYSYGYVRYYSTELLDVASISAPFANNAEWYWETTYPFVDALKQEDGSLSLADQFVFLYLTSLRFRANFKNAVKLAFENPEDKSRYLAQVAELLKKVGNDVLYGEGPLGCSSRNDRFYFAIMRNDDVVPELSFDMRDGGAYLIAKDSYGEGVVCKQTQQRMEVRNLNYVEEDGKVFLDFDMRFLSVFPVDKFEVVGCLEANGEKHFSVAEHTPLYCGGGTYFDFETYRYIGFSLRVPLQGKGVAQKLTVCVRANGEIAPLRLRYTATYCSRLFTTDSDAPYWGIPGFIVRDEDGVITLTPASRLDKVKQEKRFIKWISEQKGGKPFAKARRAFWLTRPFYKNKRIWIYSDKLFKGGDNADFAYGYANKQEDGIEKYYYLDPQSSDWERMEKDGYKLLDPRSPKGMLCMLNAEVLYATHNPGHKKFGIGERTINYIKGIVDPACIRLFHGFPNNFNATYNRCYMNYKGVVVCSNYERELYGSPENGFAPDQIIESSNPRYDELVPDNQKWLMIAPSWRPSLRGAMQGDQSSAYNPEFKNSRYFQLYNQVLTDEKFLETARRTGYKAKVFMHPRLAVQTPDFVHNDVVQALDCTKDMDYVTIMRKSDLMVTDYSSVQYDFASMRKPVVYFHEPTLPYWRVVDYDYEKIGFGEVCKTAQQLIDTLCEYMERDCELSDFYRKRIDDFFIAPNGEASKRLYEATRKIVG